MSKITPTLAVILAGGLAAGLALARPGSTSADPGVQGSAETAAPAGVDDDYDTGDGTGRSNRAVGRGGNGGYRSGADSPDAGSQPVDGGAPAPAAAGPVTVIIENFAFAPTGPVGPGQSITVSNVDGTPHTLTFTDGSAGTGAINTGGSVTLTAPAAPGTYAFFCEIHPTMTGELVVG